MLLHRTNDSAAILCRHMFSSADGMRRAGEPKRLRNNMLGKAAMVVERAQSQSCTWEVASRAGVGADTWAAGVKGMAAAAAAGLGRAIDPQSAPQLPAHRARSAHVRQWVHPDSPELHQRQGYSTTQGSRSTLMMPSTRWLVNGEQGALCHEVSGLGLPAEQQARPAMKGPATVSAH